MTVFFLTARKRSLGQSNIFRSMCQEFCPQGVGVPGKVHPLKTRQGHPPRNQAGTPPRTRQVHPPRTRQVPPGTRQVQPPLPWTRQVHPLGPGRYSPWTRYPWDQVHPLDQAGTPALAVHAGRYGQQAGGTHPTGMHSCYLNVIMFLMCYQVNGDAVTTPWSKPEEPKLSVNNIDPKQNKLEVQTGKKTKINHIF